MATRKNPATVYEGKFIRVDSRDGWEYATRKNLRGIVGIIAVTDAGELVLIEQYRPPLNANVIEIPAGLAGDVKGSEGEALATAARRELLEETGYVARKMTRVAAGTSSAGICDEVITLFVAAGLRRAGDGHGDETEQISTHLVPLDKVQAWLKRQQRRGKQVDLKVYAALYWARRNMLDA